MTDRPYTDADLHTEAARQHHELTTDPDFGGIGKQMDDEMWRSLNEDDFDAATRSIDGLLANAADVSEWAIKLGVAKLTPHEPYAVYGTTGGWLTAVQVATSDDLTGAARVELLAAIHKAVEETVCRVLGREPVTQD